VPKYGCHYQGTQGRGPFIDYLYGVVAFDDAVCVILFGIVFAVVFHLSPLLANMAFGAMPVNLSNKSKRVFSVLEPVTLTESPLFSGFLNFLADRKGDYKTIMVAVNEDEIPTLVRDIEEIMGDLNKHTGIQVMSLDVEFIKGAISS